MYFQSFPRLFYDFKIPGSNQTKLYALTDITTNVRIRKAILENITLYDEYDIQEGETPEIIAEKIYGNPELHWVIMIANQRYDYLRDFPMSSLELDEFVEEKYGIENKFNIHHYEKNGLIANAKALLKVPSLVANSIKNYDILTNSTTYATIEKDTWIATNSSTVTINKLSHGFSTGNVCSLQFSLISGTIAKSGVYIITSATTDSFTITNSENAITGSGQVIVTTPNSPTVQFSINISKGKFENGNVVTLRGLRINSQTSELVLNNSIVTFTLSSNPFILNPGYTSVTNLEHEFSENEKKRRIKIISPSLIEQVIRELNNILQ